MRPLLIWLSKNIYLHGLICIGYYLLVVLPHEWMGKWIYSHLFSGDIDQYNLRFLGLATIASLFCILPLYQNFKKELPDKITLTYLVLTLGLMVTAYFSIFVLATELVHFPQYAIMAILLFPLSWRYGDTLFWATLLGALDEAYQYFYLAPLRTEYYDFNDLIINLLGAAFGLIILKTFIPSFPTPTFRPFWRSPAFWTGLSLLATTIFLIQLNWISVYPSPDGTTSGILLVRKVPDSFWSKFHHIHFHVILPGEGVLLLIGLFAFYSGLGQTHKKYSLTIR